jgi:predicted HTH transcriptional regulator
VRFYGILQSKQVAITPEQIDLWRQSRSENQRLEFKEAKQQYDYKRLCQYCVATANEGGGFLVLGVSDTPPREVVGTNACQDVVSHAQKLFETLGFRVDIEQVDHPGGRVLAFEIPSRPRGTTYHLEGAYLMRSRRISGPNERGSASTDIRRGEARLG